MVQIVCQCGKGAHRLIPRIGSHHSVDGLDSLYGLAGDLIGSAIEENVHILVIKIRKVY